MSLPYSSFKELFKRQTVFPQSPLATSPDISLARDMSHDPYLNQSLARGHGSLLLSHTSPCGSMAYGGSWNLEQNESSAHTKGVGECWVTHCNWESGLQFMIVRV